jgi:hypothetical protein
MPRLSITVSDSEAKTKFRKAGLAVENLPAKIIRPEVEAGVEELRTYPAELPGQKYQRTGNRYRATRMAAKSGNNATSKTYTIESNPRYGRGRTGNPYTIGDARGGGQARIHQGRWKLLADVMNKVLDRIVARGQEYFRSVLERNGPP